ncbi:SUMF1/EgtB/PvdO family nonheme iron enzyme [Sorangium sp. So ce119]|uniref:SUMF1/EgtB/PvdO family nonheme iron enzyme n=1 Tax=Sorangium sp. So ce119 TaxID=3133279 RepID=UPI003F5FD737
MIFQYPVTPRSAAGPIPVLDGPLREPQSDGFGFPVTSSATDNAGWLVVGWMGKDGHLGEHISKLDPSGQPISRPGTPIYAVADGTVVAAQNDARGVPTIVLEHPVRSCRETQDARACDMPEGESVTLCSAYQGTTPGAGVSPGAVMKRGDELGVLTGNSLFYVLLSRSLCDVVKSELDASGRALDWSAVKLAQAAAAPWEESSPRHVKVSDTTGFPTPAKRENQERLRREDAAFITPSFFINDRSNCSALGDACAESQGCGLFACESGERQICALREEQPGDVCARPAGPDCSGALLCRFPFDMMVVKKDLDGDGALNECLGFEIGQGYGMTCTSKADQLPRPEGTHYYDNTGRMHSGVDYTLPFKTPLYATSPGTVVCAGPSECTWGQNTTCWDDDVCCPSDPDELERLYPSSKFDDGCGLASDVYVNKVRTYTNHRYKLAIRSGDYLILYQHVYSTDPELQVGDTVSVGQFLGLSGSASGAHLHFEVRDKDNFAYDPAHFYAPDQVAALRDGFLEEHYCQGGFDDQPKITFGQDAWPGGDSTCEPPPSDPTGAVRCAGGAVPELTVCYDQPGCAACPFDATRCDPDDPKGYQQCEYRDDSPTCTTWKSYPCQHDATCDPGDRTACIVGGGGGDGPSCGGLTSDCGPDQDESCCASAVVPGGTFDRSNDPAYPATVNDFRLDRFEVTLGRFRAFVEAGQGTQANPPAAGAGAHPKIAGSGWDPAWNASLTADQAALTEALKCLAGMDPPFQIWTDAPGANEQLPMGCITWFEAFAFCAWDGGRLPTEAEWNYAAAGGSEQRAYPWGAQEPDPTYAVYDCAGDGSVGGCSHWTPGDILNVGSRSPKGDGRWGQADLGGSVWEWNLDWFESPYPPGACEDCANGPSSPIVTRVERGGSSTSIDPSNLRSSSRSGFPAVDRAPGIGVRCARAP